MAIVIPTKPKFKKIIPVPLDRIVIIEQDSWDIPDSNLYHIKLPLAVPIDRIDYRICVMIATERNESCIFSGLKDVGSANRDQEMDKHVVGVCGEYVIMVAQDRCWAPGVNTFHSRCDVGDEEVRTRTERGMEMFITEDDITNLLGQGINPRFWLVTGRPPYMVIEGWRRLQDLASLPVDEFKKEVPYVRDGRTLKKWYIHSKFLNHYMPVIAKHWMKPDKQTQLPLNVKCEPPPPRKPVEQIEPE